MTVEPDGIGRMAELTSRYGLGVVLALVMVGLLVWILSWVMKTSAKREEALANIINVTLLTMSANLLEVQKAVNASHAYLQNLESRVEGRYTQIQDADKYQREEHDRIIQFCDKMLLELKTIAVDMRAVCKASR